MLCENKVKAIVMLTKFYEEDPPKVRISYLFSHHKNFFHSLKDIPINFIVVSQLQI